MKHTYTLSPALVTILALTLCGCGAGVVNSITNSPTGTSTPTTANGVGTGFSDYGGHAPLVGAHTYLVQLGAPGATGNGYGAVVKSLLTMNGVYTTTPDQHGDTFPLIANGQWTNSGSAYDQFVPGTDLVGNTVINGVQTNSFGEGYITGDYTCDTGYPVMLIGYGGTPSYYGAPVGTAPNATNSATVTKVSLYAGTVGGIAGGIMTFTTSTQLFYAGESVATTNVSFASPNYNITTGMKSSNTGVNGNTSGVLSGGEVSGYTGPSGGANLTSTQFSVFLPNYTGGTGGPFTSTGTAAATPSFNPAAVNMAMLGLCPANVSATKGNFSSLSYIYMNEVSTTAAAYALAGFINTSATDQTNNDEFHIGAPASNLIGLQNAAIMAGLLYDIQGSSSNSVAFDGENHTARATTPCPATGTCATGTVPNSQINSIANALAACVDSNNTYRLGTGTYSTACLTLDQYAADNGVFDKTGQSGTTVPITTGGNTTHWAFNIAQAAFNLARFPQGAGTGTTANPTTTNTYNGNVYNYGGTQTVTANNSTTATAFVSAIYGLPAGSNVPFAPALTAAPNDLSIPIQWNVGNSTTDTEIDAAGNAWVQSGLMGFGDTTTYTKVYEITPNGAMATYNAPTALSSALTSGLAIDGVNGNIYSPGASGIFQFTPVAIGTTPGSAAQLGTSLATNTNGGAIALDSSVNQYIPSGSDGQDAANNQQLVKQSSTGVIAGALFPITRTLSSTCMNSVGWASLDSAGNIWTATSQNSFAASQYVCRFSTLGGAPLYSFFVPNGVAGEAGASKGTGNALPRGLATDSYDNAWFADKDQDAIYVVAKGALSGTPSSLTLHGRLSAPRGVAVDGANTVWVANTGDTGAVTIVGGAQTLTPKYGTGLMQFAPNATGTTPVALTPNYITGAPLAATSSATDTNLGSVAIDPSGNVWASQATDGSNPPTMVFEYVGMATPTVTPIAKAKTNKTTGTKP